MAIYPTPPFFFLISDKFNNKLEHFRTALRQITIYLNQKGKNLGLRAYLFGKSSEDLACEFLLKNGCEILARNFSSKFGEIDVIAKKDGFLRFVEIKATQGDYEAEYRLTPAKFNKILKTIDFYLLQNGTNADFQVDLIAIKKSEIKWIENISL